MKKHCDKYDVYYDSKTGEYLEKCCSDNNCMYCKNRPKQLKEACKDCNHELLGGEICKGLKVKIHYEFKRQDKSIVYTCNWAVKPTPEKMSKKSSEVTCKNCLRIMKNFEFKDEETK